MLRVFLVDPFLFAHCFTTVHEWGSVEKIRVHIPVLVGQKKKIDCFCFEVSLFRFPGYVILGRFYYTNLLQTCVFSVLLGSSHDVR